MGKEDSYRYHHGEVFKMAFPTARENLAAYFVIFNLVGRQLLATTVISAGRRDNIRALVFLYVHCVGFGICLGGKSRYSILRRLNQ